MRTRHKPKTLDLGIVGITGRARAGKDTACEFLQQIMREQEHESKVIRCAGPLKDWCAQLFGESFHVPQSAFYGTQEEKERELPQIPGWSGRRILQHIGTEGFRFVHPDIWAAYMLSQALQALEQGYLVIVPDVRFLSEAQAIQRVGGLILRMSRQSADQVTATHASELEMSQIDADYTIDNEEQSLYSLQCHVRQFWETVNPCRTPLQNF
jgi:hypothetical protein